MLRVGKAPAGHWPRANDSMLFKTAVAVCCPPRPSAGEARVERALHRASVNACLAGVACSQWGSRTFPYIRVETALLCWRAPRAPRAPSPSRSVPGVLTAGRAQSTTVVTTANMRRGPEGSRLFLFRSAKPCAWSTEVRRGKRSGGGEVDERAAHPVLDRRRLAAR